MEMEKKWEQFFFVAIVLVITFAISLLLRFLVGRFIRGAARKLIVDPTR